MPLAHWLLDGGFACFERRQALALRTSFTLGAFSSRTRQRRRTLNQTSQSLRRRRDGVSSVLECRCLILQYLT